MASIIELKNIYKNFYTDEGEILVLKDVNLALERGKILGILGPSGSGKLTSFKIGRAHV